MNYKKVLKKVTVSLSVLVLLILITACKSDPKITTYTVTFDSNGGSAVQQQTVVSGKTVVRPEAPIKDGMKFDNWYSDVGLNVLYDFNQPVTANITVYAKWIGNGAVYKIEHWQENITDSGYSLKETETFTGKAGEVVSAIAKNYEGFTENQNHAERIAAALLNSDTPLVLKLFYKRNLYTVTFNSVGGSAVSALENIKYGNKIEMPRNFPELSGYVFGGWYKDIEINYPWDFDSDVVTANTVLFARWVAGTGTPYKVEHYHENIEDNLFSLAETENLVGITGGQVRAYSKTFTGFEYDSNLPGTVQNGTVAPDGSLVLKLYYRRNTYNVMFNTDGGSAVPEKNNVKYGAKISSPESPLKDGYNFEGWYKESTYENIWNFDSDVVSESITLYAKWSAFRITVTLKCNVADGTDGEATVYYDSTSIPASLFLRAVHPKSFVLEGFYTSDGIKVLNPDGSFFSDNVTGYISSGKWKCKDNCTLYAHWHNSLCFTAVNPQSSVELYARYYSGGVIPELEYSTDGSNWQPFKVGKRNGSEEIETGTKVILTNIGDKMYLRGDNSVFCNESDSIKFLMTDKIKIGGNIMSLLDKKCEKESVPARAFYGLFGGCESLTSAGELELPATTLASSCYGSMFSGCISLKEAPALPATTLASSCYGSMFSGCTSLKDAPTLPATELARYCYQDMFRNCQTIEEVPMLPATELKEYCYNGMFENCTSLKETPDIQANVLADSSCESMFKGCTSLLTINGLRAMTVAQQCCYAMFSGCTSLKTALVELPATTLASACYKFMFSECTSLENAPALPARTLATSCYSHMFEGCTSLKDAPALPATTLASACYKFMFSECTSLENAPALPARTLASDCYGYMFEGCTSLKDAPALSATRLYLFCYQAMFSGCTSLETAPALPATTLASSCYEGMFSECTSLKDAPALPATTLASYCYEGMFSECTSLKDAPALPATTLASYCYCNMFNKCTSLENAPNSLPATSVAAGCYSYMFKGCESLVVAPKILAQTLPAMAIGSFNSDGCFFGMFYLCQSLSYVEVHFSDLKNSYMNSEYWLSGVAKTGTFRCPTSLLEPGISYALLPEGWTIETF